jgi:hypothetical protein
MVISGAMVISGDMAASRLAPSCGGTVHGRTVHGGGHCHGQDKSLKNRLCIKIDYEYNLNYIQTRHNWKSQLIFRIQLWT